MRVRLESTFKIGSHNHNDSGTMALSLRLYENQALALISAMITSFIDAVIYTAGHKYLLPVGLQTLVLIRSVAFLVSSFWWRVSVRQRFLHLPNSGYHDTIFGFGVLIHNGYY